jgi:ATP-dependent RNA helicase DeaD
MSFTIDAEQAAVAGFDTMRLGAGSFRALQRMGITTPTPIQAEAIPALLDGRDVIAQARTGSGKTIGFGLPAVEFADPRLRNVQVLVLVPTRELAVQVAGVLAELGKDKGLTVATIFGGVGVGSQRLALRKGAQIVVGTPGRVLDLINQGALWLDRVRLLVLDEADEMLDYGFAPDVERIIARTTPDRQTALFSATVPDWVDTTASKHMIDPVHVEIPVDPDEAPVIENLAFDLPEGGKINALKDLLDHRGEGAIIVFGRTKRGVARLAQRLVADGYPVGALQGNMSQNARDKVMADFRSGVAPVLLATNVAARGIDVSNVEQVINVELPESPALLTHRIGRTGRMGREGQAITLLEPEDWPKWRKLERGFGKPIPRMPWPGAEAVVAGGLAEQIAAAPPAPSRGGSRSPRAGDGRDGRDGRGGREAAPRSRGGSAYGTSAGSGNGSTSERAAASRGGRPAQGSSSRRPVADVAPRLAPTPRPMGIEPRTVIVAEPRTRRPADSRPPRGFDAPDLAADSQDSAGKRQRSPRGRYDIVCSACGQHSIAPFQPDPSRPVFCDACFRAKQEERKLAGVRG